MGKLMAAIAVLGSMAVNTVSATTTVDFSFSGPVSNSPPGTIGTVSGHLVFDQTGNSVAAEIYNPIVTGVPGFSYQYFLTGEVYNGWDIAPNGDLLSGFFESSTMNGEGGEGIDFVLDYPGSVAGVGEGQFAYYVNDYLTEAFLGDATFTQTYPLPVPEPMSLTLFAAGLLGLVVTKKLTERRADFLSASFGRHRKRGG
jgi:hypothetical protein